MKNKNLFLVVAMVMFGFAAMAQSEGISIGLRGGFNYQNINGKDMNGDQLKLDMVPRFNAGVVIEIPVVPALFFQSGLLYTTKGAKSTNDFPNTNVSAEYSLSYFELPLNLLLKPALGKGHFLLGFGPYVAYGLDGTAKYTIGNISSDEKIEFANEYSSLNPYGPYIRRLDYGGNLLLGYELSGGLSLQLNAQLGMANINADNTTYPDNKTSFRNTGFGLSLGYRF